MNDAFKKENQNKMKMKWKQINLPKNFAVDEHCHMAESCQTNPECFESLCWSASKILFPFRILARIFSLFRILIPIPFLFRIQFLFRILYRILVLFRILIPVLFLFKILYRILFLHKILKDPTVSY